MLPENVLMQLPGYGHISDEDFYSLLSNNKRYEKVTDSIKRAHKDSSKTIGHCKLAKVTDKSVHAHIFYVQQNPR